VGGQFHRRRLILERRLVVEKLIDPDRQGECRPIQGVVLEPVRKGRRFTRIGGLAVNRSGFLREHRVHFIVPGFAFFLVEQLGPAHLARDDLVSLRMIQILLEQLHVFLRLMVLLLEKPLPLVFIPDPIRLWLVRGHIFVLGHSPRPRKRVFAVVTEAGRSSGGINFSTGHGATCYETTVRQFSNMLTEAARPRVLLPLLAVLALGIAGLVLWQSHPPLWKSSAESANKYLPDRAELDVKPGANAEAYALYLRGRELEEHLNDQDLQAARDLYQRAIALDPMFALARARYAIVLSETATSPAEVEQARASAEEALRLDPHLGPAHLARSLLFTRDGDENAASDEIDAALQASPKDAMILYDAARLHRRQGKWKLALEEYQQSHSLNPRDFNSAIALAYTYAQLRDWPAAAQACDRSIAVAPQWYFNKICRAYLDLWWKGDTVRANALLSSVPRTYTGDFDNWLAWMRWDISLLQHNFDEAEKAVEAWRTDALPAGALHRPLPKLYLRGCIELVRDGRARAAPSFEAAREFFEADVRTYPKLARSHAQLGTLYAFLGRKDDALREGLRAVELKPEDQDAYEGPGIASMLAVIYAQTGESDKAIETIKHLLVTPGALNFDTSITLNDLKLRWQWDPLRSDPRFQAIVNGPEPTTIIR